MTGSVADLSQIISLHLKGADGAVFVFVCYLDDTDNNMGPILGIAGYTAHIRNWELFEREVDPFLTSKGVMTLRGKDFHNGHGDFKGWTGTQKSEFVEALYDIVERNRIFGIVSMLDKKHYKKARLHYPAFKNVSPLGAVFSSALGNLMFKDVLASNLFKFEKLALVVESGNKSNNNLVKLYDWVAKDKRNSAFSHRLAGLTFVDKSQCRAIQLADFLAFHSRKGGEHWVKNGWDKTFPTGHAMEIINRRTLIRYNRIFDDGRGMGIQNYGPTLDDENYLLLPEEGLR